MRSYVQYQTVELIVREYVRRVKMDFLCDLLDLLNGFEFLEFPFECIRDCYRDRKARDWPVAPITIVGQKRRANDPSVIDLSYAYRVLNETYGGYQSHNIRDPIPAFVRYDPKRPDRSWIP